jgi:hypothetical protein
LCDVDLGHGFWTPLRPVVRGSRRVSQKRAILDSCSTDRAELRSWRIKYEARAYHAGADLVAAGAGADLADARPGAERASSVLAGPRPIGACSGGRRGR